MKEDRDPVSPVWTLVLASLGGFMAALDVVVVATALPTVRVELGAGLSQMEWTVNAYTLVFAVLLMTGAALGDRFGRRRMYIAGLLWFGAASALAALSTTAGQLIAARAVQGAGAALLMPLTLVLVADAFPPERRGMALGVWAGVSAMGVAAGPVLGGAVVQELTWQWIFWVNVPVAVVVAALARVRIRESRGPRPNLDVPGLLLVAGAMLALTWAPVKAPELGWGAAQVVGSLVLGTVLVGGFVVRERRAPHPMVPLAYFRIRGFLVANVMNFLLTFSQIGSLFFVTQFFQSGMGYTPLQAGVRMLVWMAIPMCVTPVAGRLADRFGYRPFLVAGALCQGSGTAWVAAVATTHVGYGVVVAPFVLMGIGTALYYPAIAATVTASVPRRDAGVAAGTNTALRQLGSVFGVAVMAVVFARYGGYGSRTAFLHGFRPAMAVAACVSLSSVVAAVFAPGRVRWADAAPESGPVVGAVPQSVP